LLTAVESSQRSWQNAKVELGQQAKRCGAVDSDFGSAQ